jgi:hypothetical protein
VRSPSERSTKRLTLARASLDAVRAALRDDATRVAAHAAPDVPGSEALTEALLVPLTPIADGA